MANNNNQVTKIYELRVAGFDDAKGKLSKMNELFATLKKSWQSMFTDKSVVAAAEDQSNRIAKATDKTVSTYYSLNKQLREAIQNAKEMAAEYGSDSAQALAAAAAAAKYKNELFDINAKTKENIALSEQRQKASVNEERLLKDISNEYRLLSKALTDAELKYKNLALTIGFEAKETKAALVTALSYRDVLDKVDLSLRNHQRNVGNYSSATNGLRIQLNQLLRETPALAINLNTFILALSNNLPLFFEAIAKVKEENAALRAEGAKSVPVMSQIVKGLFSWGSILTILVTGLTLFGSRLVDWISGLFTAEKRVNVLGENLNNLNDIMKNANKEASTQITTLKLLYKAATDVNIPIAERLRHVQALQQQFPEYFGQLSQEIILNDKARDSYLALADSIKTAARAKAAETKRSELELKKLDIDFQKRKVESAAEDRRKKATAKTFSSAGASQFSLGQENTQSRDETLRLIDVETKKELERLNKEDQAVDQQIEFVDGFIQKKSILTVKEAQNQKLSQDQLRDQISGIDRLISVLKEGDPKLKELEKTKDGFQKRLDALTGKKTTEKVFSGSRLTGFQKDDLKEEQANMLAALSIENTRVNEIQKLRLLTFDEEKQHFQNIEKIKVDHLKKQIALFGDDKSLNAAQLLEKKKLGEELSSIELETSKKIQDIEKRRFAEQDRDLKVQADLLIQAAKDKNQAIQDDPNTSATAKAQAKLDETNAILEIETDYYNSLLKLNLDYNDEAVVQAEKTIQAIKRLRDKDQKEVSLAALKDIKDSAAREAIEIENKYSSLRKKILDNDKLSHAEKARQIEKLNLAEKRTILSAELERLNKEVALKKLLLAQGLISNDDYLKTLAEQIATAEQLSASSEENTLPRRRSSNLQELLQGGKKGKGGLRKLLKVEEGSEEDQLLGQAIAESYSLAQDAMANYFDAERQRIQENLNMRLELLDDQKQQVISRAQSQAEIESIEKQYEAKRKAARAAAGEELKKSKRAEAKIALATELANIAVAAASNPANGVTFGGAGALMYALLAGLAVGRFALNIAAINREKFAFGGDVPTRGGKFGGRPHSGGGTPFSFKGQSFEAEAEELAIVRTKNAPKNRTYTITGNQTQIASMLNKLGGGVAFASGAKVTRFESGGYLGDSLQAPVFVPSFSNTVVNSGGITKEDLQEMMVGVEKLATETNKRIDRLEVIQVTSTVTNAQNKEAKQSAIGTL